MLILNLLLRWKTSFFGNYRQRNITTRPRLMRTVLSALLAFMTAIGIVSITAPIASADGIYCGLPVLGAIEAKYLQGRSLRGSRLAIRN